jgi:hypothetical protein
MGYFARYANLQSVRSNRESFNEVSEQAPMGIRIIVSLAAFY